MEDTRALKEFIDGSDFPKEIKDALFETLLLQMRNSPSSDYLKVIKNLVGDSKNEN